MVKVISMAEARDRLNALLAEAIHDRNGFVIEQDGKMLAVLMPYQDFKKLQEALEDVEDLRDANEAERILREQPEAYMSLAEFNRALDAAEATGELPA